MAVNFAAKDLGRAIGQMSQAQRRIQENIYPDDPDAQLLLQIPEGITLAESATLTRKDYATNVFVMDHPVYGDMDSSTLLFDGDYAWMNYDQYRKVYYELDTDATDSEGLYNGTATSVSFAGLIPGPITKYGIFNGTTSRIDLTASNNLISTTPWAISAWCYPTSISVSVTDNRVFNLMRDAGSLTYFGFGFGDTNKAQMQYRTSGGTTVDRDLRLGVSVNSWYHFAFSYDGSTIACYINGSNVLNESATLTTVSTGTATIGSRGTNNYFSGRIGEVVVWNRALATGEMINLYANGFGRNSPQDNLVSSVLQVI